MAGELLICISVLCILYIHSQETYTLPDLDIFKQTKVTTFAGMEKKEKRKEKWEPKGRLSKYSVTSYEAGSECLEKFSFQSAIR